MWLGTVLTTLFVCSSQHCEVGGIMILINRCTNTEKTQDLPNKQQN